MLTAGAWVSPTPTFNIQPPTSREASRSELQRFHDACWLIGPWDLDFLWILDVGRWMLEPSESAGLAPRQHPLLLFAGQPVFTVAFSGTFDEYALTSKMALRRKFIDHAGVAFFQ